MRPSARGRPRPEPARRRRTRRKPPPQGPTATGREEGGIVRPLRSRKSPRLGAMVVMVSSGADLRELLPPAAQSGAPPGRRLFVSRLHPGPGRNDCSLVGPVIGAPYAAMLLETLAAWGGERVLFLGWCGAIHPSLSVGDVVVPSQAFIDEGTSPHYGRRPGATSEPSATLGRSLLDALRDEGLVAVAKPVWSTDGIYRETPRKVRRFRDRGAVAVEMECSALFSVGSAIGVEAAAVLVVSDELHGPQWHPGFRDERFRTARRKVRAAVGRLCGLMEALS